MPLSDRDIIITPNRGASSEPIITLRGADVASSATMVMRVINSGTISTLSFEGTSGQLFAVSDTFAGTVFSVNDVSGIPSIEVTDSGLIKLAEYNGFVRIGSAVNNENATSATTGELQVVGGVGVSRDVFVGGGMTVVGTLNAAVIAGSISNAANATNATNAANVAITDDPNSGTTMYPTFVSATSGNQINRTDSNGLVYIPSTNRLGIGTTSPQETLDVFGGRVRIANNSNGSGWIYGLDTNHSIIMRGDRNGNAANYTNYYQFGGTIASQLGHNFWTGGALASQVLRATIADDGTFFSGNVGVGTTTPGSGTPWGLPVLEVSGSRGTLVLRTNSVGGIATLRMVGPSASAEDDWHINMSAGATSTLNFAARAGGATTGLVLRNDGTVGIGTASPNRKLTISRASEAATEQLEFRVEGGISTANFDGIVWTQGATGATTLGSIRLNYNSSGQPDMAFNLRADSNLLFLRNGGNVGISTATPAAKLHIVSSVPTGIAAVPAGTTAIMDAVGNNYLLFRSTADNNSRAGLVFQDNNVGGFVVFNNFSGANGSDSMIYGTWQDHIFVNGTSEVIGMGGKTERMRITNAGGISFNAAGTGTSGQILQSNGNAPPTWVSPSAISGGNADLLDSLDSTAFLRRDITNAMFAGQTSQLNFENQGTFFRFAFNELRFWDQQVGDIFGLDEHAYATTSMRAPIFFDRNDTAFYVDPSSTAKAMIVNGNIELTARSESWAEGIRINVPTAGTWGGIRINRSGASGPGNWAIGYTGLNSTNDLTIYSGTTNTIQVNLDHSANLSSIGSMRAPIFFDSNDTAFFVDPNSTSNIGRLLATWSGQQGHIIRRTDNPGTSGTTLLVQNDFGNHSWGIVSEFRVNSASQDSPSILFSQATNANTWTVGFGAADTGTFRINHDHGYRNGGWGITDLSIDRSGNVTAIGSSRAPIFFDSNNTAFYTDPASTSVVNNLTVSGTLTYSGTISGGTEFARRLDSASRTAISVGGNASTFYPVVLQIGAGATAQQYGEFVLERGGYDDPGFTGVNFSTFNMRMSVKASGWGFGSTYENCEALYQNVQLVANWQQVSESSRLIIWLRGATIYYLWNVVGNTTVVNANAAGGNIVESNPGFYTYTFTPTTSINAKAQHSKYFNGGAFFDGNNRAFSLGVGTNASGTDGRLDVSSNVRAPVYFDSNDTTYFTNFETDSRFGGQVVISGNASGSAGNRLIVGSTTVNFSVQDTALRPTIHAHGQYPVLTLNNTVSSNTNHGPTIQFTNNGVGNQFVIGTTGNGSAIDMGYSAQGDWNPHNGISGYLGTTFFRATSSGLIGIGAQGDWGGLGGGNPGFAIDTRGTLYNNTDIRAPIFYDANDTAFYVDPAADLAVRVFGEIANSNYQQGAMQPGALNIGRTDRDYGWDGTSWAGDIRAGILANCSELWEFVIHDSGDSVESVFRYNGGDQLLMGRDIGWGQLFIEAARDFRAPIFYDSNNTAYFVDPNSTSNFSTLRMDGQLTINNASPTIFLQDTDHQTSMIHCNSNIFYVLRGNVNSTSWNILNGRWPLEINLNSGDFVTGGSINARTEVTAFGSDLRLKENIRNIDNAVAKVMQLNGVYYDWKDMVEDVGFFPSRRKNEAGVIAQEVEKVLPQAVAFAPFDREWVKGEDGGATSETYSISGENYLTVKYEKIVPLLIEAIKEQQTTIDQLRAELDEMRELKKLVKEMLGK